MYPGMLFLTWNHSTFPPCLMKFWQQSSPIPTGLSTNCSISIQDNYTFAQPGIQRLVNLLSRVVSRVDKNCTNISSANSVQYLQFAFRWMNNLLIREIPLRCIIRLWDTYLSEGAVTATYVPSTNFNDSLELNTWSMNSGTPFSSCVSSVCMCRFLRFWSKSLTPWEGFSRLDAEASEFAPLFTGRRMRWKLLARMPTNWNMHSRPTISKFSYRSINMNSPVELISGRPQSTKRVHHIMYIQSYIVLVNFVAHSTSFHLPFGTWKWSTLQLVIIILFIGTE